MQLRYMEFSSRRRGGFSQQLTRCRLCVRQVDSCFTPPTLEYHGSTLDSSAQKRSTLIIESVLARNDYQPVSVRLLLQMSSLTRFIWFEAREIGALLCFICLQLFDTATGIAEVDRRLKCAFSVS